MVYHGADYQDDSTTPTCKLADVIVAIYWGSTFTMSTFYQWFTVPCSDNGILGGQYYLARPLDKYMDELLPMALQRFID